MKSYSSKSLRTLSKAGAWYICALLVFGVVFFIPKSADAALTSPVPIVTGSQYGFDNNLGLRDHLAVVNGQYEYGWTKEHPENRRIVSITVGTKTLLVAAFVNRNSPSSTCTGATPICKLEFRVSSNNGVTWASALEGSTPWLNIMGPKFDYTLYVDPVTKQDVWVSYTYGTKLVTTGPGPSTRVYTKSKIQQLIFNSSSGSSWSITGPEGEPTFPSANIGDRCYDDNAKCTTSTAVAVQALDAGGRRVWGVFSYNDSGIRHTALAYNDSFPTVTTWTQISSSQDLSISGNAFSAVSRMSDARLQAVPVGTERVPIFFYADPENYAGSGVTCNMLDSGNFLILSAPRGKYGNAFDISIVGDRKPLAIEANSVNVTPCNLAIAADPTFGSQLAFSVAAYPTGPLTSRVVFAYSGGVDSSNNHNNAIRVRQCTVTISETTGTSATVSCLSSAATLPNSTGFKNPSVGFDASFTTGKAWISAWGAGEQIVIFQETSAGTWSSGAPELISTSVGSTNIPTALDVAPSGLTVNSELFPFIFSDLTKNRLVFSANAGGTSIGTVSPLSSANAVWGYGWAENFGWLNMNCINKPDEDCVNLFGVGIGATAHSNTSQLPNVSVGTTTISPTNVSTYPVGGYAWSPNSGFLSFERRDSVYDCGGDPTCGDTDLQTDDNDLGQPPGAAYKNAAAAGFSANVPIAKYNTANQHVYGWGRFLNLCNYDTVAKKCKDKDNGWVRLRGYYTTGVVGVSATLQSATALRFTAPTTCATFPNGTVLAVNSDYAIVFLCEEFGGNVDVTVRGAIGDATTTFPTAVTAYNVTGKDYGLDAFWTGDHYEFAGWAWSNEYGWIRFNPIIFIGFAWLETLFGNVYSGFDVSLPAAVDLSNQQYDTCGDGNDPCFISTYRIDAKNAITGLRFSGTGQDVNPADSAGGEINKGAGTCTPATPEYCVLQGVAGTFLTRGGVAEIPFPTVGSTTTSYRNALGKLDVGGLTNILDDSSSGFSNVAGMGKSYYGQAQIDKNRFGSVVYKTHMSNNLPVHWTINELAGWTSGSWTAGTTPVLPLNSLVTPTTDENVPLRSQIVHVQGSLTVDGQEGTFSALNSGAGTLTITGATGDFPSASKPIGNTTDQYASCSGCALIVDPGGDHESYYAYTSYTPATQQFSGVQRLSSACENGCAHTTTEKVRWVWRLPYAPNGIANIAQRTTIVVDGDLNIQYNIIAADPKNDPDLAPFSADSIRDLPTIAFIVKGNVIIDPKVSKVTGAFIVTSRNSEAGHEPDSPSCPEAYAYSNNCGGSLKTGDDNSSSICNAATKVCRPLTIVGLLFARQFDFQRIGNLEKNTSPAERVIADERLFLNPPPGLEDVTKALPNPQRTLP